MNCLSLVQGFFICPFTFGVLGCGEASCGKRCALPSRNSRKSRGEARWARTGRHGCMWLPGMGLRLSALHKPTEHCSESLCSKMSLLDSQCTNSSLIAKGTWLLDPGLTCMGGEGHYLLRTIFISESRKNHVSGFFNVAFKASFASFQNPSFWQTRSTSGRGWPFHLIMSAFILTPILQRTFFSQLYCPFTTRR